MNKTPILSENKIHKDTGNLILNYQSTLLKIARNHTICLVFILLFKFSFGQGRIVVNEFMSWSGCNTTSEFIELMNFGPGPMDIGCYIVTNGTYSVTIPPNTILQTGQYYVLSGQDVLSQGCGNTDSSVHVDLNWTTCNCTNVAIPTVGDGFLQDGGNANEKIVLLDPNLNVIDAVSRKLPVTPSNPVTTPDLNGGCTSRSFDLDTMNIAYESINNSTGVNNSFARKVDGDCGWVKTTAISAHAPNKTGSSSSTTYDFTAVSTKDCGSTTGSISIQVNASDVNSLFPMNYTLAYDSDQNGIFDTGDQYTYGVDSTASTVDINNLAYGRYRITVASSSSCNLKSFDFYVFNCYTVVLPVKLLSFDYKGEQSGKRVFKLKLDNASTVNTIVLEGKAQGDYKAVATLFGPFTKNELTVNADISSYKNYRLRLTSQTGVTSYSKEIKIQSGKSSFSCWPNPVGDKIFVRIHTLNEGKLSYSVVNSTGITVSSAYVKANGGEQTLSIPAANLNSGIYYLRIQGPAMEQPALFKLAKL